MDDNMTLLIDPDTRDLVLDDEGNIKLIYGDDTTSQCIRLTLQTWIGEFFLDLTHGTEYDRILGRKLHELPADEIGEVLRTSIFQEGDVAQIDDMAVDFLNRRVSSTFAATLYSGQVISMEVTA